MHDVITLYHIRPIRAVAEGGEGHNIRKVWGDLRIAHVANPAFPVETTASGLLPDTSTYGLHGLVSCFS